MPNPDKDDRTLTIFAAGIGGAFDSDAVVILTLSEKHARVAVHTPSEPPPELMDAVAEALRRLADGLEGRTPGN